ncbi:hypothetical protein [Bradyrhizobium iriomotense]|uniref:hypothetical protein n=1 Tax=Bradyrhizobium iriomotense TaxID=441950 RepID=UPI001B8A0D4D|nr:hypothetical protein [Bradyrhizobium iriomotense]MBR0787392.1 hypothetical protein [Bradyrhizobium iriomotense]
MSNVVPIRPISLLRALRTFADDADALVRRYDEIERLFRYGELSTPLAQARKIAELSANDVKVIERCIAALDQLDPAESYEDNDPEEGELRRGVIKARLTILVGSFPNGAPGDPEVYVRAMLEHACSIEGLSLLAVDATCHEIVATQKFLPAVEEVVKTLSAQQAKWNERLWAIYRLADMSRRVLARIEALQSKSK